MAQSPSCSVRTRATQTGGGQARTTSTTGASMLRRSACPWRFLVGRLCPVGAFTRASGRTGPHAATGSCARRARVRRRGWVWRGEHAITCGFERRPCTAQFMIVSHMSHPDPEDLGTFRDTAAVWCLDIQTDSDVITDRLSHGRSPAIVQIQAVCRSSLEARMVHQGWRAHFQSCVT